MADLARRLQSGRLARIDPGELDAVLGWIIGAERTAVAELVSILGTPSEDPALLWRVYQQLDRVLFRDDLLIVEVAGLSVEVPAKERQARYRRLMAAFHPDRYPDFGDWFTPRAQAIQVAYRGGAAAGSAAAGDAGAAAGTPERARPKTPVRAGRPGSGVRPGAGSQALQWLLRVLRERLGSVRHLEGKILAMLLVFSVLPALAFFYSRHMQGADLQPAAVEEPAAQESAVVSALPDTGKAETAARPLRVEMGPAPGPRPSRAGPAEPVVGLPEHWEETLRSMERGRGGRSAEALEAAARAAAAREIAAIEAAARAQAAERLAARQSEYGRPAAAPESVPEPEAPPAAEPVPAPEAPPAPEPVPEPEAPPAPEPEPEPLPELEPESEPEPEPRPLPEPAARPHPAAEPDGQDVAAVDAIGPDVPEALPADEMPGTVGRVSADGRSAEILERQVRAVIERYRLAFVRGDIETLMLLLDGDPQENAYRGREWFRLTYGQLFSRSSARRLFVNLHSVAPADGGIWEAQGNFALHVTYPDASPISIDGRVRYRIQERADGWRIRSIEY